MQYLIIFCLFYYSSNSFAKDIIEPDLNKTYAYSEIIINSPIEEVWEFLSHDEYARHWSIFFYSIEMCPISDCPVNTDKLNSDIGYIRRSYRNKNKEGLFWDEETLSKSMNEKYFYKSIRAFNFHGYGSLGNKAEHLVEQILIKIDKSKTKLIFRSSLIDKVQFSTKISSAEYFLIDSFFTYISQPRTSSMFTKNLFNIKEWIEKKKDYKRVYKYQKYCDTSRWYCTNSLSDL